MDLEYLPEEYSSQEEMISFTKCPVCSKARPIGEKIHHCRVCNKCVIGFDHHCFVLDCCIAKKNLNQFLLLLLFGSLGHLLLASAVECKTGSLSNSISQIWKYLDILNWDKTIILIINEIWRCLFLFII
jgi:hypothetical protein